MLLLGQTGQFDVVLTEIGGTVGDMESLPFIEAVRQLQWELPEGSCMSIHLTLVPYLSAAKELKTKPTQHSVQSYYYMESNKYMLLEKFTEKIEGTSSTTYTYDDKGNPVSSVYTFPTGKVGSVTNYSYEFDSKGNWIKRSSTFQDGEGQETGPGIVETREISYWN